MDIWWGIDWLWGRTRCLERACWSLRRLCYLRRDSEAE